MFVHVFRAKRKYAEKLFYFNNIHVVRHKRFNLEYRVFLFPLILLY